MLIKKCCLWSLSVILCLLLAACNEEESTTTSTENNGHTGPKTDPATQQQLSEEGDCANFDFSPYMQNGKLTLSIHLRVLRDKAKVYPTAETQQPNKTLEFGKTLMHRGELSNGRIKVATLGMGKDQQLGWVSRKDLLCTSKPIINPEKGLEKKFYIKTENRKRKPGEPAFINAYPMPAAQCNGKCRELSRFTMYFIVDQHKDWYLLADDYHITLPLVGWVQKKDGYLWDTAYGLRPRDDLKYVDEQGNESEGAECVYQSLDDAINKHHCMPVLGGNSWYQGFVRIPLLDIVDSKGNHIPPKNLTDKKASPKAFYKVALAVPGVGVTKDFQMTPKTLGDPSINLEPMKFIDVFFLIDGTDSMQSVIETIRGKNGKPGLVQNIANTLEGAENFKGAKFRFGFRVYRDIYSGDKNLGQGLPLEAQHCEELPDDYLEKNRKKFQDQIANVQASDYFSGPRNYPENLFGGLKQVLNRDLRSCPGHTKLLFIIGDHGYSRGAVTMNNLRQFITRLKRDKGRFATFFIQTANKASTAINPDAYKQAYGMYCNQGYEFLQTVLEGKSRSKNDNYLFRLQDESASPNPTDTQCEQYQQIPANQLGNHILEQIKGFSNTRILSELTVDLRGGKALKKAIESLQRKHTDVPGLFWDFVEDGNCEILGKQCDKSVYDVTFKGYIPVSDNISLDVWMIGNQLENFQKILQNFRKLGPIIDKREEMVRTLVEALTIRVMKPAIQPGEKIANYIQRKAGLPVSRNTILLSYDPEKQLKHESIVPDCELERLVVLATKMEKMLSIIYEGYYRPIPQLKPYPKDTCTRASEIGKRIPFFSGRITKKRLGEDDTYSYEHGFRGMTIYWVPEEYLP
jgi:uncharacterized protein YnzC (UPF0291/DUF896 family)